MQNIRYFRLVHVLVIVKEDHVLVPDWQFQDGLSQSFRFLVPAVVLGSDLKVFRRDAPVMAAEPRGTEHILAGVHSNLHDPGFHAAVIPELPEAFIYLQEGFLNRVFRERHVTKVHKTQPFQRHLVLQYHTVKQILCIAGRALFRNHPVTDLLSLIQTMLTCAFCRRKEKVSKNSKVRFWWAIGTVPVAHQF